MITHLYYCPIHGEFEYSHKISEHLEECPICQENHLALQKVKQLISGGTGFILSGGGVGWAKESYSK